MGFLLGFVFCLGLAYGLEVLFECCLYTCAVWVGGCGFGVVGVGFGVVWVVLWFVGLFGFLVLFCVVFVLVYSAFLTCLVCCLGFLVVVGLCLGVWGFVVFWFVWAGLRFWGFFCLALGVFALVGLFGVFCVLFCVYVGV